MEMKSQSKIFQFIIYLFILILTLANYKGTNAHSIERDNKKNEN